MFKIYENFTMEMITQGQRKQTLDTDNLLIEKIKC